MSEDTVDVLILVPAHRVRQSPEGKFYRNVEAWSFKNGPEI